MTGPMILAPRQCLHVLNRRDALRRRADRHLLKDQAVTADLGVGMNDNAVGMGDR